MREQYQARFSDFRMQLLLEKARSRSLLELYKVLNSFSEAAVGREGEKPELTCVGVRTANSKSALELPRWAAVCYE